MNKSKQIIAVAMASVLSFSVFTGCGTKEADQSATTKETASTKETATTNEPYEISMMTFDYDGDPLSGENGATVKSKIEAYTNTKLDMQFVPYDSYEDKLSITLASGEDMPMIIAVQKLSANIVNAAKAGALWPIGSYITDSEKLPNLSQANEMVNKSISIDGSLYGVYRARVLGRLGVGYRDDWAEKLGLAEPKTIEDIYNMLYQFTYGDPDGNGVDDTYGLDLCKYDGPFDIMQTWFGAGNGWVEQDGKLVPVHQTAEYMEALNWFKKLYDEKLIASDFAVRDTATWLDDMKNQKSGMYVDTLDNSRKVWDYFTTEGLDASMNLVGSIAKDVSGEPYTMATAGYNGFFVITKAAETEEDVQKCLEFLDKMNDDEMLVLTGYGLEGIHYEFGEDGSLIDLDVDDKEASKAYTASNQLVSYIPNIKPVSIKLESNERLDLQEKIYKENEAHVVYNPAAAYMVNSETYTLNGANLDTIIKDARIQFIVGQIDEKELQDAYAKWDAQGGTKYIEEVNTQYQADK